MCFVNPVLGTINRLFINYKTSSMIMFFVHRPTACAAYWIDAHNYTISARCADHLVE